MARYTNENKPLGLIKAMDMFSGLAAWLGGSQSSDYYFEWGGDNPNFLRITTEQATVEQIGAAVDAFGSLAVATDKASISADDADTAAITCNDAVIAGDSDLDYVVYGSDGSIDFSGTVAVVAGVATLNFTTAVADTYLVKLARQGVDGSRCGFVEINALTP